MPVALIPLADHPNNNDDPSSSLANPSSKPGREIFRHRAGYLATLNGLAFPGLFATLEAAQRAQGD